ncbi:MAG: integrase core domain-containing protein [Rhizomicrobium sp.]
MIALLGLVVIYVRDSFRSQEELKAENIVLRHQLNVLRRKAPGKARLRSLDRALFVWLYRLFPSLLGAIAIVKPSTVIGLHRAGYRAWWRWKSRGPVGRPKVDRELRDLIRRMSLENPLWGAPRIHGEILLLGFTVAQAMVSKYMFRRSSGPSQGWRTFLRNHRDGVVSITPTIAFERLYALVVLRHLRRKIVHIAVTRHPTVEWLARQITETFPWDSAPTILLRDNDEVFGEVFQRHVRAIGIRDHPITPRSPWQNGYVERVIGSIRRECLDHMIVLGEIHLQHTFDAYARYYNSARTHLALGKNAPIKRSIRHRGDIHARPFLGGLHHQYVRTE